MAIEDDDKPRKKITHEIGQDLSLLSVEELTERIALMNSEIERLQQAVTKKRASKGCGEQFFQVVGSSEHDLSQRRPCERRDPYAAAHLVARPLADLPAIAIAGGYGSLRSQGRRADGVESKNSATGRHGK